MIARQAEEVRIRRAQGVLDPEFDPAALRLMAFAVCSYPRLLPQITRMTAGHGNAEHWDRVLGWLAAYMRSDGAPAGLVGQYRSGVTMFGNAVVSGAGSLRP